MLLEYEKHMEQEQDKKEYLYIQYNCNFCHHHCNASYFDAQRILDECPEIQFCENCGAGLPGGAISVKSE